MSGGKDAMLWDDLQSNGRRWVGGLHVDHDISVAGPVYLHAGPHVVVIESSPDASEAGVAYVVSRVRLSADVRYDGLDLVAAATE